VERILADYATTSVSVGVHPVELLRPHLPAEVVSSADLGGVPHGERVAVAGLAIARQRPATANGVVFMLLEDEHGQVNLVVPPPVYERYRAIVRGEPLLLARGRLESAYAPGVTHVVVDELTSLVPLARQAASVAEIRSALPSAHSFGHR
jgi:error-prone DNA polymerase